MQKTHPDRYEAEICECVVTLHEWVRERVGRAGRNESNLWFFLISYKSPLYNIFTQFPIMKAINIIQYTAHVSNVVKDSVKSNKNLWCATMRRKHKSIKNVKAHIYCCIWLGKVHVKCLYTHASYAGGVKHPFMCDVCCCSKFTSWKSPLTFTLFTCQ